MNHRQKLIQQQFLNNEQAVIQRLNQAYSQSLADVENQLKNLTFNIGKLQQKYEWMDDGDPKKAKVKSQIQSKIYQKQYQEQLKAQLDGILNQLQTKSFLTVSDYLDECYNDGFIGTIFDAQGQGVPFVMPIDQESMVRAVQLDSKISKGLYTRLGEDVGLLKLKIASEVSRSISTGKTFKQTAKMLENQSRIGYNNAIRIARTEGHRIQTTATMDAMQSAKSKGADVVKQWDSTLDGRTRSSHIQLDGEVRELNEKFSNGLDLPGDPNGKAAEVINCRCALLQRARWAVGGGFTKMNNFTKQLETFESPEEYDEFKKAFFSPENKQYMKHVEQMEEKYGTKDYAKILDKMTDKEYDQHSLLTYQNPIFNKNNIEHFDKSGIIRPGVVSDAITSNTVSLSINPQKQNRHIPDSKGFIEGRSRLTVSLDEAQELVNKLKGTGYPVFDSNGDWANKERVKSDKIIGVHVNPITGEETETNKFMIVYSKTGSHIIPRKG